MLNKEHDSETQPGKSCIQNGNTHNNVGFNYFLKTFKQGNRIIFFMIYETLLKMPVDEQEWNVRWQWIGHSHLILLYNSALLHQLASTNQALKNPSVKNLTIISSGRETLSCVCSKWPPRLLPQILATWWGAQKIACYVWAASAFW